MSEQLWRKYNRQPVARRSIDEILGMAKGVMFDRVVNVEEAEALRAFLRANPDCATTWPWYALLERLNTALEDGQLAQDEQEELADTLLRLAGGNPLVVDGHDATSLLPIDRPRPPIEFVDARFCFTGVFATGPRKRCAELTKAKGASVLDRITTDLDYLVIGAIATRDWKHSSWGRKIEKAMEYKQRGHEIAIIAEHHWADVVQEIEVA